MQVAGVIDLAEAEMLIECGVDFLGFPLRLDYHAEDCSEEEAALIVAATAGRVECVLITYETDPGALADLIVRLGVSWVQLHAPIAPEAVASLHRRLPSLRILKSLVVRDSRPDALEHEVAAHAPHVDAFLTDTFDPSTGASGATGRVHDWWVSRSLVTASPHPVVLAGGLTPENVGEAILRVRPWAVDVHTGVETSTGRKGETRVRRFLAEARSAFRRLEEENAAP